MTMKSNNLEWGFFGTMKQQVDAEEAWNKMLNAIVAVSSESTETVRDYLDSRDGRHLADEVLGIYQTSSNLGSAMFETIANRMNRLMPKKESQSRKLPPHMPYLLAELMSYRKDKTTLSNLASPINHFMTEMSELDELLGTVAQQRDDHFGLMPEDIEWRHVHRLATFRQTLGNFIATINRSDY